MKTEDNNEICKRCNNGILEILPESSLEYSFYKCNNCGWNWAQGEGESLHDRWLSPISIVLYSQIYEKNPQLTGEENAKVLLNQKDKAFLMSVIEEIERELSNPIQKVSEIHDFEYPDEVKLRKHLKVLKDYLKKEGLLGKSTKRN
jgi:hypothetical protein